VKSNKKHRESGLKTFLPVDPEEAGFEESLIGGRRENA
jgi:hypothetical protein